MPPPPGPTPESDPSTSAMPRLLVTAGPTREPIDAVRFIGNRSSGRMGHAIATEAARRGWPTTLLLGPVTTPAPDGPRIERFQTGTELQDLLTHHWPSHDMLIMAAAVADFVPESRHAGKLSRRDGDLVLTLKPAPDLLTALAKSRRPDQTMVGFALEEAADLPERAAAKLQRKNLDAIVANPLAAMEAPDVDATLLTRDGACIEAPPGLSKPAFAAWLLDHLATIHDGTRSSTDRSLP
ncbi:MAG: phosphopantothenoylcysteine decarboxylase [Phycisphaerales bacterium]|nr:phosphopantothenoylcysteine decarboxylase [Phycisphaerales bacterium]